MTGGAHILRSTVRATLAAALAACAVVVTSAGVSARAPAPAAAAPVPPERRVVVFTDSVGLGAKHAIPAAFPDGWSVHVDGQPARFVEQMESQYVRPRLASNPEWFGDHVVIAAGYNAPFWDWARFERSIDAMVETLTAAGVKHIHWVTLREVKPEYISAAAWRQVQPYYWYFPTVNAHLEAALARHSNLTLADWRAVADQPGLTYDAIHLNSQGAALYADVVRRSVIAAETRLADQTVAPITVPDGAGAAAAFVTFTTTEPRTAGFLAPSASACDQASVSVHNYVRAQTVAHSAIVPLAPGGTLCVRTRSATNLIADTGGVFPADGGFVAVTPRRWVDTRTANVRVVPEGELRLGLDALTLGIPLDEIEGLALSVTAVDATGPGWLRVLPCGSSADTSNVNYLDATATPNLVITAPSDTGDVCVSTRTDTHVVVDVFGVFTRGFTPAAERVFDSRADGGALPANAVTRVTVGADVDAVVVNLTAVNATAPGYVTAYPCAGGRPLASNLNVAGPAATANVAIVAPDGDGAICIFNLMPSDLVVDVQARLADGVFTGRTPERLLDTRG